MADASYKNDGDIVRKILTGDRDAFGRLVERHLPMVHALVRANLGTMGDVDDIAQNAFLAAFTALDKLREPEKFAGWLATITRNECMRHVKLQQRERHNAGVWDGFAPSEIAEDPAQRELHEMLEKAVRELDVQHREILLLYYFMKKDMNEIEAVLGISRENAKKRLQRARAALETHIVEKVDELMEGYAPRKEHAVRVVGAIAAVQPAWIVPALGATAVAAPLAKLWGVQVMTTKTIAGIGSAVALLGIVVAVSWGGGRDSVSRSEQETETRLSDRNETQQGSSTQTESTREDLSESVRATTSKPTTNTIAAEDESQQYGSKLATKTNRTATIGGNPQRTGYVDAPAPLTKPAVLWETGMSGMPGTMPSVDDTGRIFSSHGESGGDWLSAYSPKGELLWEFGPVDERRNLAGPGLLSNGDVVFGFRDGELRSFDPNDGSVQWSAQLRLATSSSALIDSNDGVYIEAPTATRFMKIDGMTGEVLWPEGGVATLDVTESNWFRGWSATLSPDEQRMYSSFAEERLGQGALQALDANTGDMLWRFTPEGTTEFLTNWATPVVSGDGIVYIQDAQSGYLYAVADNGDAGAQLWAYDPVQAGIVQRFETTDESYGINEIQVRSHDTPRLVATDGEAIYMGVFGSPASVHAVTTDGNGAWHTALVDDAIVGSPVVTNDAVYVLGGGDRDVQGANALYCLDRNNGEILWQMNVASPGGDVGESIAIAPDGTIYVASTALDGAGSILRALR
ncbi:MAG: sigma-70 family RNA polymerase sigma factor [Candidatus Hydrogenedentes bacterium]|nr:sigma-70 family RNA polymerase sigma factor [Candidatus Hydrogenedentota bacterium]